MFKRRILHWILKNIWNAITIEDLDNSFAKLDGMKKSKLIAQAKDLQETELWNWLNKEMQKLSIKKLYEAKEEDQIIFSQACLYTEQVRKKIINDISNTK